MEEKTRQLAFGIALQRAVRSKRKTAETFYNSGTCSALVDVSLALVSNDKALRSSGALASSVTITFSVAPHSRPFISSVISWHSCLVLRRSQTIRLLDRSWLGSEGLFLPCLCQSCMDQSGQYTAYAMESLLDSWVEVFHTSWCHVLQSCIHCRPGKLV